MPDPQQMSSALLGDSDPWVSSPLIAAGGPAMAQALGGIASNMASLPQQSFEASEGLRNTGQYNPAPIVQAAQLLMGGGAPAAEAGAAGIFGGKLARGMNPEKYMQAGIMEMKGATPEEIWHETGWGRGADKQWRFEIPDQHASMKELGPQTRTYGDVLDHQALFHNYPELANRPVHYDMPAGDGAFHPWNGGFSLSPYGPPNDNFLTALHEGQHAIQQTEGFARGGSPQAMLPYAKQAAKQISSNPDKKFLQKVAHIAYGRLAGEVEANNVMSRQPFTNIERRAIPPWETEDVKRGLQLVRPPNPPLGGG